MSRKQRAIYYALAFTLPCVLLLISYIYRGLSPFGPYIEAKNDVPAQYIPFLAELQRKLKTGSTLAFSWHQGMGVNFYALIVYYLMSPWNLLLLIWPKGAIPEFFLFLTLIKIGLCGVSMYFYLIKKQNKPNIAMLVSMFFALSSYNTAYIHNIMWFDAIYLFPLIIYAAEHMFFDRKRMLYTFLLAASMVSNYYIAMIICIYLVLYYLYLSVDGEIAKPGRVFGDFVVYSILAAAVAGIALFPEILALKATSSAGMWLPERFSLYLSWSEVIAQHFGMETIILSRYQPPIYCGICILPLLYIHFRDREVTIRKKLAQICMIAVFLLSFNCNKIMTVWHGMHIPRCLNHREAFCYIFFVLYIAYGELCSWNKEKTRQMLTAMPVIAVSVWVVAMTNPSVANADATVMTAVLAIYTTVCIFCLQNGNKTRAVCVTLTAAAVVIELSYGIHVQSDRQRYADAVNADFELEETEIKQTDEEIEKTSYLAFCNRNGIDNIGIVDNKDDGGGKSRNHGMLIGYEEPGYFSSLASNRFVETMRKLGFMTAENSCAITGMTPVTAMLFGNRYYIEEELSENPYKKLQPDGSYGNPYALPVAFAVKPEALDIDAEDTPIGTQNRIMKNITGTPCFIKMETYHGKEYKKDISDGEYVLEVACSEKHNNDIILTIDEHMKFLYPVSQSCCFDLSGHSTISVRHAPKDEDDICTYTLYRIDHNVIDMAYTTLSKGNASVQKTDQTVEMNISLEPGEAVFCSIPYDDGWKAVSDGKEIKIRAIMNDTFIKLEPGPGQHHIIMTYHVPGFAAGTIVTIVGVLLTVLYAILQSWAERQTKKIHQS